MKIEAMAGLLLAGLFVGQPLDVVVACVAGTYAAFAFAEAIEPRRRMFALFIACVFMGCASAAVWQLVLDHFWGLQMEPAGRCAMGMIVSFLFRPAAPAIIEVTRSGRWINWLPFVKGN